ARVDREAARRARLGPRAAGDLAEVPGGRGSRRHRRRPGGDRPPAARADRALERSLARPRDRRDTRGRDAPARDRASPGPPAAPEDRGAGRDGQCADAARLSSVRARGAPRAALALAAGRPDAAAAASVEYYLFACGHAP